jgi:hypothetical protein
MVTCPVIKDKMTITIKRNKPTNTASGLARNVTADTVPDEEDMSMMDSTTAEEQGKFLSTSTSSVSTSMPEEISLLPFATSDQHLTIFSLSTQDETISDDDDQLGSFQHEIFPGPPDPSITNAMRLRRDTNNASRIATACTANTTFVDVHHGPCIGRANKASLDKAIKSEFACVDSGATHDMSNGTQEDFMDYKPLPKGSHVLVADNHPIECLGIGTQFMRIKGRITGRQQVLHVPALKAPLISVQQHRR